MSRTKTPAFNYGLLRFMREHHKLSQEDLIFRLRERSFEIAQATLSDWENGKTCPDAKDLPILAEVLGIEPKDFYKPNDE